MSYFSPQSLAIVQVKTKYMIGSEILFKNINSLFFPREQLK
jgi:hypothetical protein